MNYEEKVSELFDSVDKNDITCFRQHMNRIDSYLKLWELETISTKMDKTSLKLYKKRYNDFYNELVYIEYF